MHAREIEDLVDIIREGQKGSDGVFVRKCGCGLRLVLRVMQER